MSSYCYEYSFSVVGRRSLSLRGEVVHRQGWEEMRNDEGGRHNANTMSESGIQLTLSCDGLRYSTCPETNAKTVCISGACVST